MRHYSSSKYSSKELFTLLEIIVYDSSNQQWIFYQYSIIAFIYQLFDMNSMCVCVWVQKHQFLYRMYNAFCWYCPLYVTYDITDTIMCVVTCAALVIIFYIWSFKHMYQRNNGFSWFYLKNIHYMWEKVKYLLFIHMSLRDQWSFGGLHACSWANLKKNY